MPGSPAAIPLDYEDRVYAGVLGKLIGVYLGRPFEGWTYERITSELGEIDGYVIERTDLPLKTHTLVVTDDDIGGTFTFLRALPDHDYDPDLSPQQIGETWLNYLIERRTVLWWGGLGNSTEHTAYLRLKAGIPAPESGSAARNGRVVAEQIGAQIFIDGWAMVCPGDPERAADLARRAASVSHDGEAIHGARVIAALEAQAFVEADPDTLLNTATSLIPRDCLIQRLIADVRHWHASGRGWRWSRQRIEERYGYHVYGGNCHIVPNHALVINALLHGAGDFRRSLMIVNTCGRDTDCNSGNLGCILGISGGIPAIDGAGELRGPVRDRLYLPSAEGGSAVTDALTEAYTVAGIGRRLAGQPPRRPKGGARFHFEAPGSVQGFHTDGEGVEIANVAGHSRAGCRSLAVTLKGGAGGRTARVWTATFIPPRIEAMPAYRLLASPSLYPGQEVRAGVVAGECNGVPVRCHLVFSVYHGDDPLVVRGPGVSLGPGEAQELCWRVEDTGGRPIHAVGIEVDLGDGPASGGATVYLDYLGWAGDPDLTLTRPEGGGTMWRQAWVSAVDRYDAHWPEPFRLVQNRGTGLLMTGARTWHDYEVSADVTPHLARSVGLAVRVQGLHRYYALCLGENGMVQLRKERHVSSVLARRPFDWEAGRRYRLFLRARGPHISGGVDGTTLADVVDPHRPLLEGGIALLCEEGRTATTAVRVRPAAGDTGCVNGSDPVEVATRA